MKNWKSWRYILLGACLLYVGCYLGMRHFSYKTQVIVGTTIGGEPKVRTTVYLGVSEEEHHEEWKLFWRGPSLAIRKRQRLIGICFRPLINLDHWATGASIKAEW